jgi:N-methylhydantoinase A/oxoprolinase/acetone carboxylase beta subunit
MHIGVDVGGTNTDAVIMDGRRLLATYKTPTTEDVSTGVMIAIREVLMQAGIGADDITATMIGTTQFTNAFVERKRLTSVGVIRISLPSCVDVRPMLDWPQDLTNVMGDHVYWSHGGYQFDGSEIAPFSADDVRQAAQDMRRKGLRRIAVSCTFSPVNSSMEMQAAEIIRAEIPDARITLSSEIGRLGMVERENAAIMNAALSDLSQLVVRAFTSALASLRIQSPLYLTQNDGTLMAADYVERFPVLTFASGPTNSMRGAAFLSGLEHAIVVDIGGTTTDVGVLANRFPRESSVAVDIGGVRTNFRMPDILSIGLGGGSCVRPAAGKVSIGPDSVGYALTSKGLVFGGDVLTTTDIAVADRGLDIGDSSRVEGLDKSVIAAAVSEMHRMTEEAIDRMKTAAGDAEVVLVGGGGILISRDLKGVSKLHVPQHASVANAIGAAMAQVGGETDRIFSYEKSGRDVAIQEAKAEAIEKAAKAGAIPSTVSIVDVEELPMAYMPGGAVRIRVKAVGDLDLSSQVKSR